MAAQDSFADWEVAIPVFNAIAVTERALDFLLDSGVEAGRIRLLDDGSTDPAWERLQNRATEAGCRYHRHAENQGYTTNINRAFETAAEFVLLLNSDCLIRRGEIEQLVAAARAFPMLAGIGPLSNHAGSQSIAIAARRSWMDLDNAEIALGVDHLSPQLGWKFGRRPIVTPSVNGFCTLWRAEVVRSVGGFDAQNFARGYGEEDDICFRLLEAGWLCAIAPWVLAIHFKTQSFTAAEREARKPIAMAALERLHGRRFVRSVVDHFDNHPLFRQIAGEAVDV